MLRKLGEMLQPAASTACHDPHGNDAHNHGSTGPVTGADSLPVSDSVPNSISDSVPATTDAPVPGPVDHHAHSPEPNAPSNSTLIPAVQEATAHSSQHPSSARSPAAVVHDNEPLSTEALPIPDPPPTTEAEDAFQQVFDIIEPADDNFSDSGYSESVVQSSSTSMSSSVRDFEFENGRRYHAFRQGHYLLPNDDAEQEREDMKHATILSVCADKLYFAPISEDQHDQMRVLDVGTGTGIWCVEMGDLYPSAEIIGVDLSPIQPDWVPPNVRFVVDDIESEWLYQPNHFDMIHARHMAIAIKDWNHVLSSAWTHLKPGGWLEFCELDYWPNSDDGTMTPDNAHLRWTYLVTDGLARAGVDLHAALLLKERVIRAGFQNVTEHVIKVPIGQWPRNQLLRKVGMYMHAVLYDGLQGEPCPNYP